MHAYTPVYVHAWEQGATTTHAGAWGSEGASWLALSNASSQFRDIQGHSGS